MKPLEELIQQIVRRVSINLREFDFDVKNYIHRAVPIPRLLEFCAFYGITPHHPVHFRSRHSNLAGSYFLGRCEIDDSVIYKSDIRGDELKRRGDVLHCQGADIPVEHDQAFMIRDSFLVKTLVHSYPHDPERLYRFPITS
ncbi:MAG: transferase, partial [Desulfobacteraceae bacterium 4572_88]